MGAPGAGLFVLTIIRYLALLSLYGGFTVVIVSILIIQAPAGMPTPPVSPAMQCVMNLTMQYFAVYMMMFMTQTFSQLTKKSNEVLMRTLDAACATVKFCPMLAILFVGTRMRALQLSDNKGSPQCYAQDAMFLSSYAVLLQLLMTLALGAIVGVPETDEDGNPVPPKENRCLQITVECVKWLSFIGLYGGAITIVVSVLAITPETANCSPSDTLVDSTPFVAEQF